MSSASEGAIAVVGLGAILPDAMNVSQFWGNLLHQCYSINEVPPERWNPELYYDPDPAAPDKTYSKIGGWVRGFHFDWKDFRIPPKVAAAMDESQKWALAITAQTLGDYGYPNRPLDLERTATILGNAMGGELHYLTVLRISYPEIARTLEGTPGFSRLPPETRQDILHDWQAAIEEMYPPVTEDSMPGELANVIPGRVANIFNLRGPNYITDAACASSLAAVDSAVQLLAAHRVDAVLTGGVDHNMGASTFVKFCKIGALSATGSRPFGKGADGFVMGEGAAMFLLKRLEDAEQQGDRIYAVIRGVGGASDGKGKGIYAPNPIGQQLATRRAWENAGLDPATASLLEAHGTSTRVGDVVEVDSLQPVFGGAAPGSIALGSVKSNIGHLKAAAGAAGLLKGVLALHHKTLPPTLNAATPNPDIDFKSTPFSLVHVAREWSPPPSGGPRRCGVSAYGFGGTNFHVVLEEYVPGALSSSRRFYSGVQIEKGEAEENVPTQVSPPLSGGTKPPVRGILAIGADTTEQLKQKLEHALRRAQEAGPPPREAPALPDRCAPERLLIDFGSPEELVDRLGKALRAMEQEAAPVWKAIQSQGIFRGSSRKPGKIAFLFPGQGSQYLNMGAELISNELVVASVFREADHVMTPILGKPLSSYIFVDSTDPEVLRQAKFGLMQTAITQPAMLAMDTAIFQLLETYGFRPDMVMGHSLGEYAALIAAGAMPFADAMEAVAARGREMTAFSSLEDNGWMAAVMAPYDVVQKTLAEIDGYVVAANINSYNQCVIGGASKSVEEAIQAFGQKGFDARRIPVSHAFHTRIVAPASKPLRLVLNRLSVLPPRLPIIANVSGGFYPRTPDEIRDVLEQQVASPVQWIKGLETLYAAGARIFVEVGPKKALKGFVDDVLGAKEDVISLFTNHPKVGELPSFNHALCGLYAAGCGLEGGDWRLEIGEGVKGANGGKSVMEPENGKKLEQSPISNPTARESGGNGNKDYESEKFHADLISDPTQPVNLDGFGKLIVQALQQMANGQAAVPSVRPYDRNEIPTGSVVITGTGLGLPGAEKAVMDQDNALRILHGEQFIDLLPERFRQRMVDKQVTRVVKGDDGSGRFEVIQDCDEVIRLAGRAGSFDLTEEYGVPDKLVEALDITTQLAMAAGLDALREAGIPMVQTFRQATTGKMLLDRWMLPEALRDETGVIFASAFPGTDRMVDEFTRYYTYQSRLEQLQMLEDLRCRTQDPVTLEEILRRIHILKETLEREPYVFDRRFMFRVLAMGHSQFAEYIGARGPNTQVNAACSSTTQAVGLAEDWIRSGRCRRVIVIAADNPSGDHTMEWFGSGMLATGAAATDDSVEEAAIPFDRRRHGMIIGMGACAMVVESEDAVRERGMRGIVELLSSEISNSAFHGTRLNPDHIAQVMDSLVSAAERRFGIHRYAMAPQTVFMSHETFTPARGGSASAEVAALRRTFGEAAGEIVVSNTKGFTGHPFGVGIEDVVAIKILEYGIVPPVPNLKEIDHDLGVLNLSRGGRYPVQYALHLSAGFGSQIAMVLLRRIPGGPNRVDRKPQYRRWLADVSGYDWAETEVVQRNLRVKGQGAPAHPPAPSPWQPGTGPVLRAQFLGNGVRPAGTVQIPVSLGQTKDERRRTDEKKDDGRKTEVSADRRPQTAGDVVGGPLPAVAPSPAVSSPPSTIIEPPATVVPPPPTVSGPPSAVGDPSSVIDRPSSDAITGRVLEIVAEKTGYPMDMLDVDLDLEADLGVDTVKQAETLQALREAFDIPRQENLKLRDYPTLTHVIAFVKEMRPDLVEETKDEGRRTETTAGDAAGGPPSAVAPSPAVGGLPPAVVSPSDSITGRVLEIVAEKTGYPQDMLELDLDLEADLGVDTVKQAETFQALREAFDIPRQENLKLRDYPTLAHVIAFVKGMRPDLVEEPKDEGRRTEATGGDAASGQPSAVSRPSSDPITPRVLEIVAEKTGYPQDMLELDLDLEADLGVDTVKQAETFQSLREAFDIPRQENLKLRDYPTLAHVIAFVKGMRPDLVEETKGEGRRTEATTDSGPQTAGEAASGMPPAVGGPSSVVDRQSSFAGRPSSTEDADRLPRRVPVPALRQAVDLSKPTGVRLDEESRVVVALDRGGVGKALMGRLEKRGVDMLVLNDDTGESIEEQLKGWVEKGPVQGVYWLPALDVEPCLEDIAQEEWDELNRRRVRNLYTVMRFLYGAVAEQGTFLVAATRLGGLHGYSMIAGGAGPDVPAPLGGAVTGFVKAYKREQNPPLVKAVDFEASRKTAELAEVLIDETLLDPGCVEVGYWQGERYSITLVEQPVEDGSPGLELDPDSVFLVTGAAGGITSAIVADLASASGGTFYLLDLVSPPDPQDALIQLFRKDKEALKAKLIEAGKAAGERLTPAKVEKQILSIERQEAALRAVQAVEAAGGRAYFRSVDLLDGPAVAKIVDEIRQRHGVIDALIHAAGVEISRALPDKDPQQFDLVFGVKAGGFFNLLHAAKGLPIRASVVFSSVAGRFGNAGQTDYSAANDLLCKLTSSLRTWRPGTRGIALDWTAWAGIGMATRGSIPKVMELAGIEMLPPEVGIPTVRRELTRGGRSGEVVVAGKLGMLFEELDPDGGFDADRAAQWLAKQKPRPLMVGEIKSSKLHSGFEVETVLDPKEQPFLHDHAMDGTPLLPGVMGTEAFAELARALAPGWSVAAVENIRFLRAFKFFNMEPQHLYMAATIYPAGDGELLARTELKSRRALVGKGGEVQEKTHFTASIRLRREPARGHSVAFKSPPETWSEVTKRAIYDIYFHGPAYQVLEGVSLSEDQAWGLMATALPDDTRPAGTAGLMAPRLIELCLQTAGVWELKTRSVLALPAAIRSVEVFQQPEEGSSARLYALVKAVDGGASFDAQVLDESGTVYVSLSGYSTVPLPVPVVIGN